MALYYVIRPFSYVSKSGLLVLVEKNRYFDTTSPEADLDEATFKVNPIAVAAVDSEGLQLLTDARRPFIGRQLFGDPYYTYVSAEVPTHS
jgi:hypothetical protein